ncbi:hypothetical protein [Nonomuraea sp. bgisy101]|uniref:hypothetical protein n=1 Tax=Nonomuraea sp. bgisy101 TaxID=3413784 RepID=UPI003D74275B
MHPSFEGLHDQHADIAALLDQQPAPLDIPAFCEALSAHLGRSIIAAPFDPDSIGADASTCFWAQIERGDVRHTLIAYAATPAIPADQQAACFLDMLADMLRTESADDDAALERLAGTFAPDLLEFGGLDLIKQLAAKPEEPATPQAPRSNVADRPATSGPRSSGSARWHASFAHDREGQDNIAPRPASHA